ncbi:MAG: tetratricopeptide repeat protein [Candidatus Aminicenantes bacterium]|nr:tetratricopeptide repeat protein [Candidatus Aminicenantes bacterium]
MSKMTNFFSGVFFSLSNWAKTNPLQAYIILAIIFLLLIVVWIRIRHPQFFHKKSAKKKKTSDFDILSRSPLEKAEEKPAAHKEEIPTTSYAEATSEKPHHLEETITEADLEVTEEISFEDDKTRPDEAAKPLQDPFYDETEEKQSVPPFEPHEKEQIEKEKPPSIEEVYLSEEPSPGKETEWPSPPPDEDEQAVLQKDEYYKKETSVLSEEKEILSGTGSEIDEEFLVPQKRKPTIDEIYPPDEDEKVQTPPELEATEEIFIDEEKIFESGRTPSIEKTEPETMDKAGIPPEAQPTETIFYEDKSTQEKIPLFPSREEKKEIPSELEPTEEIFLDEELPPDLKDSLSDMKEKFEELTKHEPPGEETGLAKESLETEVSEAESEIPPEPQEEKSGIPPFDFPEPSEPSEEKEEVPIIPEEKDEQTEIAEQLEISKQPEITPPPEAPAEPEPKKTDDSMSSILERADELFPSPTPAEKTEEITPEQIEEATSDDEKQHLANRLHLQGRIHFDQGDYKKSMELYSKSLKIKEELDDKKGIAINISHMGKVLEKEHKIEEAVFSYLLALKIMEEVNKTPGPYEEQILENISRLKKQIGKDKLNNIMDAIEKKISD